MSHLLKKRNNYRVCIPYIIVIYYSCWWLSNIQKYIKYTLLINIRSNTPRDKIGALRCTTRKFCSYLAIRKHRRKHVRFRRARIKRLLVHDNISGKNYFCFLSQSRRRCSRDGRLRWLLGRTKWNCGFGIHRRSLFVFFPSSMSVEGFHPLTSNREHFTTHFTSGRMFILRNLVQPFVLGILQPSILEFALLYIHWRL